MYFKKVLLSIFFFLLASTAFCQSEIYKYLGVIDVEKVGQFNFQLTYKVEGNTISGNTITNAGNANETKAYITGKINVNGSVEFTETNILKTSVKDKSTSFCMVTAKLTKRTKLGLELLEGTFKGTDKKNNFCGSGTIYLVKKVNTIPDSVKTIIATALKDTALISELSSKTKLLSTVSLNKVYCNIKSIRVRLYDSGYVDGDEISISYNGKILASKYTLNKEGGYFLLDIENQQDNIILIKTLNEGLNPPNTATIDLTTKLGKIETYQFNAPSNSSIAIQLTNKR